MTSYSTPPFNYLSALKSAASKHKSYHLEIINILYCQNAYVYTVLKYMFIETLRPL